MKKIKNLLVFALLVFTVTFSLGFAGAGLEAKAETAVGQGEQGAQGSLGGQVTPMLFTTLTLDIVYEGGYIKAKVKNEFTLFFSTVEVYVYLYSSDTYYSSIDYMTLESYNYIADLNIGQTVFAQKPLASKYWKARTRFKIDKGAYEEMVTLTYYVDSNGNFS